LTARLISSRTLWGLHVSQGRAPEISYWAAANALAPEDVSVNHDITIEDSSDGRVIHYRAYLRNSAGRKHVDPAGSGEALTEERVVPLVVEPPEGWPVYALTERPTT
jgi:hypothetical protein